MGHVHVAEDIEIESPVLVEGLPGAGLVGKIAVDHLVEAVGMRYYGAIRCDGLPEVAVYEENASVVRPPVRLYADEASGLLALQSDVPVSPEQATEFAGCVTSWLAENDVLPVYLSGLPEEKDGVPELYGVATGDAGAHLERAAADPPREGGMVSGPTGALLSRAAAADLDAVGLIVQTQAKFPDPESARILLENGIEPIAGVDVETDALVERAGEIQQAREQLAERLQNADGNESTQAQSIRGFQ